MHFNNQHEINIVLSAPCIFKYRFKDGKIILGGVVEDTGGSALTKTNLQPADAGHYACRAVSDGGKILSKLAKLVVKGTGDLFQTHYNIYFLMTTRTFYVLYVFKVVNTIVYTLDF